MGSGAIVDFIYTREMLQWLKQHVLNWTIKHAINSNYYINNALNMDLYGLQLMHYC